MQEQVFSFSTLPQNRNQLSALPEADLSSPFKTAALVLLALNRYEESPYESLDMLAFLAGPRRLSEFEKQFIADRLKGKGYVVRSFFEGSSPANNYAPSEPWSIRVSECYRSYEREGYALLELRSSGADSPRQIQLRKNEDKWYLWENYLLADIRIPACDDPWA